MMKRIARTSNNEEIEESARPAMSFFLGRQPILDRNQHLVAYELLFRDAHIEYANFSSNLAATASVIAHASQLGLEKVIGNSLGFLNADEAVLMSDIFQFLPRDKIILEILETIEVTEDILERIETLAQAGFRFALDDVADISEGVQKVLPFVEIVKIDLHGMPRQKLFDLTLHFKRAGKKLLAEKVESVDQFKMCVEAGFDFFQGYYFAKPIVLMGKSLSPSQVTITRLISLISADAENAVIERTVKEDIAIGLNLLRLVNSAGIGARRRIDSLNQALIMLGRAQLMRWLQIMLYAEPHKPNYGTMPLLVLASTRGKLLELMAQRLEPARSGAADTAFTVGIMSLMDTLLYMPMREILEQISVVDEVSDALLFRKGRYGQMLKAVEFFERIEDAGPLLLPTLGKLSLHAEDLRELSMASFDWSNEVFAGVAP